MIVVEGLGFRYVGRKNAALRDVSFSVNEGESILVLGPSGGGKSTLALCIKGAIPSLIQGELSGRVRVDGRDTRRESTAAVAQHVGLVFQDPEAQFCMLAVEDEIAFGLENLAVPRSEMSARIDEALLAAGLDGRRHDRIDHLSGGQKQRLAIACVLAQRPKVIVLDEPTAQLDPAGAREVVELLGKLRSRGHHTLVIVEHRLDQVMHLIDRVLVLGRDGQVIALGPPREILRTQRESLDLAGVWLPQVSELAMEVERLGLCVDPYPLTVSEAISAFRPIAKILDGQPRTEPDRRDAARVGDAAGFGLDVHDLSCRYPHSSRLAVDDVSFTQSPGEMVALVGANGAGKSTLARILAGLLRPSGGAAVLQGRELARRNGVRSGRHAGYVFQYPEHQFIGQTVLNDVAFGLITRNVAVTMAQQRAMDLLREFGLDHLAAAHPFSLSHGEQRRLSVASMIILDQPLLILDEPTFGQDRRNVALLLDRIEAHAAAGKLILLISHDMRLVADHVSRALVLSDSRLVFDGQSRDLFADSQLLERARLEPPALWQLSLGLGLSRPFCTLGDAVSRFAEGCALRSEAVV